MVILWKVVYIVILTYFSPTEVFSIIFNLTLELPAFSLFTDIIIRGQSVTQSLKV